MAAGAILFSHPDDFLRCELEVDRWLHLVGDAFRQARIRPLALWRRNQPLDRGWVSQLTDQHTASEIVVALRGPRGAYALA
jgi:hypothetical protein